MKLTSICFVIFLIFFLNASALQQFINGSVTDEETCLPMAGVNVIIDSAILGTTTESKAEARLTTACNYQDIRTPGHQDTKTPRHMASLVQGYNYDIFISYRQKDNKHDGWVTSFVENLKGELESTFREEVSIYFDVNPHHGLLETHDVDASLKDKLKCPVFIPVISRTYCDLRSFAWEHEFVAFVNEASKDRFGLRVKLPGGNVACRVLPVKIHDLDANDIRQCETVIGGHLRGVEFIYREPGLSKPLTPEDDVNKNQSNTRYRIQINKTANAIKEIISGIVVGQAVASVKDSSEWLPWEEGAKAKKRLIKATMAKQGRAM